MLTVVNTCIDSSLSVLMIIDNVLLVTDYHNDILLHSESLCNNYSMAECSPSKCIY